jgi:hypothetical protein
MCICQRSGRSGSLGPGRRPAHLARPRTPPPQPPRGRAGRGARPAPSRLARRSPAGGGRAAGEARRPALFSKGGAVGTVQGRAAGLVDKKTFEASCDQPHAGQQAQQAGRQTRPRTVVTSDPRRRRSYSSVQLAEAGRRRPEAAAAACAAAGLSIEFTILSPWRSTERENGRDPFTPETPISRPPCSFQQESSRIQRRMSVAAEFLFCRSRIFAKNGCL